MTAILSTAERNELTRLRARYARSTVQRERATGMGKGRRALGMMHRFARYLPTYVKDGDIDLSELAGLIATYETQLGAAVAHLIDDGRSWGYIADELGLSRPAVMKRYGHLVETPRARGGQPANLR